MLPIKTKKGARTFPLTPNEKKFKRMKEKEKRKVEQAEKLIEKKKQRIEKLGLMEKAKKIILF